MAQVETLEELKEQNLKVEQEDGKQEKPADAELEEAKNEDESEAESETDLESKEEDLDADDDESKEGKESWMQSDEQTSEKDDEGERKFTGGDVAAAKRKLKGKLEEKTAESDVWKEKYETLKNGGNPQAQQNQGAENKLPRLADFQYDEEKYGQAMAQWVQHNAVEATRADQSEASQADANKAAIDKTVKAVDDHYLRVDELVTKSSIAPEVYQAADATVRKVVESILPKSGDAVTDGLIERLGEGSEKVIYFLGRNTAKREEFAKLMRDDRTGLSAAMMLGQLKKDLSGQSNKGSNAPSPSGQLNGDGGGSSSVSKLKRDYDKADDVQARFDIKRKAKSSGVDVSSW